MYIPMNEMEFVWDDSGEQRFGTSETCRKGRERKKLTSRLRSVVSIVSKSKPR